MDFLSVGGSAGCYRVLPASLSAPRPLPVLLASPAGMDVIGCLFCLWGSDERCCSLLPSKLHLESDVRKMKPSSYLCVCVCVFQIHSQVFFIILSKKTDFYDFYRGCCRILESLRHISSSTMFSPCGNYTQGCWEQSHNALQNVRGPGIQGVCILLN